MEMKKIILTIVVIISGLIVKSNPLPPSPIISEFYFNGNFFQIEFYFDGSFPYASFDNLYLVSSLSTVAFVDGISIIQNEPIVIDQNDLVDSFDFNPQGDHIYVTDASGFIMGNGGISFGGIIPAPGENQSIALFPSYFDPVYYIYYYSEGLEEPPTIGNNPLSINARGWLKGYLYDNAGTPVPNVEISFPSYAPYHSPSFTDSTGYFIMGPIITSKFHFNYFIGNCTGSFYEMIYPNDTTFIEANIDTFLTITPEYYNYPNPFSTFTTFNVKIPEHIKYNQAFLTIWDIKGKQVDRIKIPKGYKSVDWNSSEIDPGIYFYTITIDNKSFSVKKLIKF